MNIEMKLGFGWWNTSLSPTKNKNRSSPEQKEVAGNVVKRLLNNHSIDFLGLGEVSIQDINHLRTHINDNRYIFTKNIGENDDGGFDLGIVYNCEKLRLDKLKSIISSRGERKLKIALRVDFQVALVEAPLYIFVSHWPSRMFNHEGQAIRDDFAMKLKCEIEEIQNVYSGKASIVLMGDYNDEPFDKPLAGHLCASRDRRLVRRSRYYLYNPFWRLLGEKDAHLPNRKIGTFAGTCFYSSGSETKWNTFDQIIVSSACLLGLPWHLNEEKSMVLDLPPLDLLLMKKKSIFDHFPIQSILESNIEIKGE